MSLHTCMHARTRTLMYFTSVIGASLCDLEDEGSGLRGCSLETSCASRYTSRWPQDASLCTLVCVFVCVCVSASDLNMSAHALQQALFKH